MKRRKTNVRQATAGIRLDLIKLGLEVPKECKIVWSGGERRIWINVNTRQVWGSVEGRVYMAGKI